MRGFHDHRRPWAISLLVCLAILLSVRPEAAQSAPGNGLFSRSRLTGNWGGMRTWLEEQGVSLNLAYTGEAAGNIAGSPKHTARYTQQVDFETLFDLNRLAGVPGAKVQFEVTERFGRSLSKDVLHNEFSVQELYGAGQNFRLAELNYQQDFYDHRIQTEVGWSPVGDHFASLPDFCKFQNGVICGHANAMTQNSGAHNFPTAQWGARIKAYPLPSFYVATGVFQVNPDEGDKGNGFDLSFDGTGVFVPLEVGWKIGRGHGELPGDYKIGAYYNSSDTPDVYEDVNGRPAGLTGAALATRNGRYGGYLIASQTVYRPGPDSPRGLRLGVMGGAGDQATSRFSYFWIVDGVWQGTFPGRDHDFVAFMGSYARTNPRLLDYQRQRNRVAPGSQVVETYESIVELDYGAQITHWLKLRPNLQYVIRSGGTGETGNALVLGLYTNVTF